MTGICGGASGRPGTVRTRRLLALAVIGLGLAGCQSRSPETTGSIAPAAGTVVLWADAQPALATPESDRAAGGAWVSPPRR